VAIRIAARASLRRIRALSMWGSIAVLRCGGKGLVGIVGECCVNDATVAPNHWGLSGLRVAAVLVSLLLLLLLTLLLVGVASGDSGGFASLALLLGV